MNLCPIDMAGAETAATLPPLPGVRLSLLFLLLDRRLDSMFAL
jgi:hypothetical protein